MATSLIKKLNFQKTATFIGAVFLFFNLSAQAQEFHFSFESDPASEAFGRIHFALPEKMAEPLSRLAANQIKQVFRVYVGEQIPDDLTFPSIAGKYKTEANQITFVPRFDPPPGISYVALFDVNKAFELFALTKPVEYPERVSQTFQVPDLKPISGKAIASIYPSSDTLPANLLRMYVYFEQPMGLANPHDHILLLNEEGQEVSTPFVEITEGLWNHNRTRLTLFFHPGRVKRGVGPNLTIGAVLEPGSTYQLKFDPEWTDALGRPIGTNASKTFIVEEAKRSMIDPAVWKLVPPKSGTLNAIQISWPEPLDHALVKRMITIEKDNDVLEVIPELLEEETRLDFIAPTPWEPGEYILEIDPRLEDLSGNTPFYLFDTETPEKTDLEKITPAPIRIPFVIE